MYFCLTPHILRQLYPYISYDVNSVCRGWSGGAMVLGKLPVPGRPTIRITVGQGPNYIFTNDAYCLEFRAQKFPLIFFTLIPF